MEVEVEVEVEMEVEEEGGGGGRRRRTTPLGFDPLPTQRVPLPPLYYFEISIFGDGP